MIPDARREVWCLPDARREEHPQVALLRADGVPRHRAEELEQLTDLAWRYSEPGRAGDVARGLTSCVQEVGWDSTPLAARNSASSTRAEGL